MGKNIVGEPPIALMAEFSSILYTIPIPYPKYPLSFIEMRTNDPIRNVLYMVQYLDSSILKHENFRVFSSAILVINTCIYYKCQYGNKNKNFKLYKHIIN